MSTTLVRRPLRLLAALAVVAVVAVSCRYNPADYLDQPALSECMGQIATIGLGTNADLGADPDGDGQPGQTHQGTEGDDVVVIAAGPVVFDGLGGNDLICINDTTWATGAGPIVVNGGDGDDTVWDRRFRATAPPADQSVEADLGAGNDRFYGSAIADVVDAGPGDDEVNGGGGIDTIDCGADADVDWAGDYTDPATVATNCETTEAGTAPVDEAGIRTLLDAFGAAHAGVPGVQIGLRFPGQPDVIQATGIDDLNADPQTPMPTDGTYNIASITKTFTSAIILQLVEEGHFTLDTTLDTWLPAYPHADGITVRMLLDHTSGMFDDHTMDPATYQATIYGEPEGTAKVWAIDELLAWAAPQEPTSLPGESWAYNNVGYWALGDIIEAVTGQTVYEVFDQRIFTPLSLDATHLGDGTVGYTQHSWLGSTDMTEIPITPLMTWFNVAGAGVSSTEDLLTWGETIYGGEFLGAAMDAELHTMEHEPWAGDDDRYGLGVQGLCPCADPLHPEILFHDGNLPGTRTDLVHDTGSGITTVFRANTDSLGYYEMEALVLDLYALVKGS